MKTIFEHRTVRAYKNTPIADSVVERIIDAASRASTTGNMQVYSIIVTKRQDIKQKLWEAHFKQNMVLQAPLVLTFCADFNRFNHWCKLRNAQAGYDNFLSFFTAAIDALLATQNAALEAEYQNLGICYLGTTTYMAQKIIDILKLPKGVVPVTTLVVGHPEQMPELTARLPLRAIVHSETYNEYTDAEIEEIYAEREATADSKKFVSESGVENLAQVFTNKRYTKNDNITFSKTLLEVLKSQGFMNNQ